MPSPRRPRQRLPPLPEPRAPLPRLRLSPVRPAGSVELDAFTGRRGQAAPPFVRWDEFLFRTRFRPGEHITIVGTTGSGKTVLARELLRRRDYVVVFGTKNIDEELYTPFQRQGYALLPRFSLEELQRYRRIIFRPRVTTPDQKGLDAQRAAFERALGEIFDSGGQIALYFDEVWYVANRLKLATTLETYWTAGRSMGLTVVASTQLPVSIPLLAFDQATHLFLFRNSDRRRIDRMSEFAGADVDLVRQIIPRLPRHEFLYIDTRTGTLNRSKVIVPRNA